ncbi:MAG: phosphate ABC transporter substrate-binding protein PstS [Nitrospirae bacterium]|nr:phosphate ABC transporter substrate-binding protein PstS [Nitrospirota bacterium]
MKRTLFALAAGALLAAGTAHAGDTITGAGATFPYPIYGKWAHTYNAETGVKLNYQSIGSGGGIKQIKARTVDFGASDAPMKPVELNEHGLIQFPMIMGGVVPVVNLDGVAANQLRLDAGTLADIFLGKIKKWNDARIAALNPGVTLPAKSITVVHRADGSGTTWIFTNYLTKVSKSWTDFVGNGSSVEWPVGIGGKGNEGVAAFVKKMNGAIGYVEYAYALQNNMTSVMLKNADGNYVTPTAESFQAAAAGADWAHAEGYYVVLTNQPGAKSWPITGASFILIYKDQKNAAAARQVMKFFDWSYRNGDQAALELNYVPMPAPVADMVRATWARQVKDSTGAALWPVR